MRRVIWEDGNGNGVYKLYDDGRGNRVFGMSPDEGGYIDVLPTDDKAGCYDFWCAGERACACFFVKSKFQFPPGERGE